MTRAPSVSFSPVEWLCSCVSVSFFLLLSLSCRCSSISPLQFAAWPADPCQPQLIKSDTSSNTELAQLTIFPWNLPHHCFFGFIAMFTIRGHYAICFGYFHPHMVLSIKWNPQPFCRNPSLWERISSLSERDGHAFSCFSEWWLNEPSDHLSWWYLHVHPLSSPCW